MANRIQYQIVGRYMDGTEVTGYHLQSMDTGKSGKYTREQTIYLVGRGQVTNCSGQIYQDKVLLRGVGISLESLPVKQENGDITRTEGVGKIRKGASAADVMTQLMIVKLVVSGTNVVGYVLRNAAGQEKAMPRNVVLELAKQNKLGNARLQDYNGLSLRGINQNLKDLPRISYEKAGISIESNRNSRKGLRE